MLSGSLSLRKFFLVPQPFPPLHRQTLPFIPRPPLAPPRRDGIRSPKIIRNRFGTRPFEYSEKVARNDRPDQDFIPLRAPSPARQRRFLYAARVFLVLRNAGCRFPRLFFHSFSRGFFEFPRHLLAALSRSSAGKLNYFYGARCFGKVLSRGRVACPGIFEL